MKPSRVSKPQSDEVEAAAAATHPRSLTMSGARLTIRIDFDANRSLGHGKIRLLELIARTGSIAAAAREMAMSYRRAWVLVDELSLMFKDPVVERQTGGKGGGSARITPFGLAVVQTYRSIQDGSMDVFADQVARLHANLSSQKDEADATKPLPPVSSGPF